MERDDEWTCGKGLAAGAALPEKLAELTGTMAEMLERHTKALDVSEAAGAQEQAAYESLVKGHREVADRLKALSEEMKG